MRLFTLTAAALLSTGCASVYNPPSAVEPQATIIFDKGYGSGVGFGRSSWTEHAVEQGPSCKASQQGRLTKLSWTSKPATPKQILANQPISILSFLTKYQGSFFLNTAGINSEYNTPCRSRTVFVPRAGRTYRMMLLEGPGNACQTQIIDVATGQRPPNTYIDDNVQCIRQSLTR